MAARRELPRKMFGAALDAYPGIQVLAGDTDGVDGLEEIAGDARE